MGVARVLSAEQLLQDAVWLTGLARSLAHDRDDADDLVQDAWIAAWRRQPDASRPMRAWLTKVVRDLAGMKRRSEQRRAAREAIVDDAQAPVAPDELLEQMRLHRCLVDLVLELDEPYRSTIPSLHTGAVGFSASERYLGDVAQRAFLSLWSHPNLFRARAKELADLIVIFGDDVIIFSDKSCEFKNGEYGWSRWYRRAVTESAHQLHRAAGWIRKHPTEIYMDAKCEQRFPLNVPHTPAIHLVAVATGAHEAAAQHFGGDGTLALNSKTDGTRPFEIGDLDPSRDFVHVFDDVALSLVLCELDTVSDFVAYLGKRARLLRGAPTILAESESTLLVHYLKGMNESEYDFVLPQGGENFSMILARR
jgi:hypothetical protein